MTTRKEVNEIDNAIRDLLININDPRNGLTRREIANHIWNHGVYDHNTATTEEFPNKERLLLRRIIAYRRRIYKKIRKDMNNQKLTRVERPDFIPYAQIVGRHWRYLNAVNFEKMPLIIKSIRRKADSLNSKAEVLEAVF